MLSMNHLDALLVTQRKATARDLARSVAASILILFLLMLASLGYGLARLTGAESHAAVPPVEINNTATSWTIEGALTEACTCSVPCTCNFGEGPSPHHYCYSLYAYDIRKGKYGDVTLDGLRFGATELKSGKTIFIDERANDRQREALRIIAGRIIQHLSASAAEEKAKTTDSKVRYVSIKQEYTDRKNRLEIAGVGEFAADYIMGLDKRTPVIVRNNTSWQIYDAIKAKTTKFKVKLGSDSIDTSGTNSNQGDFKYSDKTDFSSPQYDSCGAMINSGTSSTIKSRMSLDKEEPMCGMKFGQP